jgi:sulfoxide reductase heme-binding subunit YedZ
VISAAASASGSALWYLTRGSGAVSLVLLTVSVALGIANVRRWRAERWPRFVLDRLHRNVSLLVLVFLAIHILTSVVDGFAPISLLDVVLPFGGTYRPLWLGLGALAFDLLLALTVTSLLRARIGFRGWRAVHWLAYACWPLALVHGVGTGSDSKSGWMLALVGVCVATVWLALWVRIAGSSPERPRRRTAAGMALVAAPLAFVLWLPLGPLGAGWASRAGTPASLLAKASAAPVTGRSSQDPLSAPFTARLSGTIGQAPAGSGQLVEVHMPLSMSGGASGRLDIRIVGQPTAGGGVTMQDSQVTLGTTSRPVLFRGRVDSLNGTNVAALLTGQGRTLRVTAALNIDAQAATVSGSVRAQPAGSSGA